MDVAPEADRVSSASIQELNAQAIGLLQYVP